MCCEAMDGAKMKQPVSSDATIDRTGLSHIRIGQPARRSGVASLARELVLYSGRTGTVPMCRTDKGGRTC